MLNEVHLLQRLKHPNVVAFDGWFWDAGRLFVILEYAPGGDLSSLLSRQRRPLSEAWIWTAFKDICLGLQHLHEAKVVHRDIKALNILIGNDQQLKIADFGVSRHVSPDTAVLHTVYGTPLYASPELCQGRPYTEKTDIWSLGVLLYEMAALKPPFQAPSVFALAKAITNGKYPPLVGYSQRLIALVDKLLQTDPVMRPTITEIVAYLSGGKGNEDPPGVVLPRETSEAPVAAKAAVVQDERTDEPAGVTTSDPEPPVQDEASGTVESPPVVDEAAMKVECRSPRRRLQSMRRLEAQLRRKRVYLQNLRASMVFATDEAKLSAIAKVDEDVRKIIDDMNTCAPVRAAPEPVQRIVESGPEHKPTAPGHVFLRSDRNPHKIAHRTRAQDEDQRKDRLYAVPSTAWDDPPAGRPVTARDRAPRRRDHVRLPSWWPDPESPRGHPPEHDNRRRRPHTYRPRHTSHHDPVCRTPCC